MIVVSITRDKVIWHKATLLNAAVVCKKESCQYLLSCYAGGSTFREFGPGECIWDPYFVGMEVLGGQRLYH